MPVGEIVALWRYPVKSMQGEEIEQSAVTDRGLPGDRGYAVMDREMGLIASAKYPRKWNRLLECRAAYEHNPEPGEPLPPVRITFPDGSVFSSAQPEIDGKLSELIGRAVTLISEAPGTPTREADRTPVDHPVPASIINREAMALAAPEGTFFDYAPLHLLTTATLARLSQIHPAGRYDARRFRPNLVIAPTPDIADFVENQWIGHAVKVGAEVRLNIIDPCPRCAIVTLAQADLSNDREILRTVAQNNSAASATLAPGVVFPAVAGVYARVVSAGEISCGGVLFME
jgi:uncharacterized protein YcbX